MGGVRRARSEGRLSIGGRDGVYRLALLLAAAVVAGPTHGQAQDPCPRASGAEAEAGWAAYRANDMEAARSRFEAALARCPNDPYARTGLGYVELREDDTAGAGALFEEVVAAVPDDVDALVGLGLVSWRLGDVESVRDHFTRALRLSPDHPTALEYLARIDGRVRDDPSQRPDSSRSDEADEAWRRGDTDRARELYETRLESNRDDGAALHRMALMRAWSEEHGASLRLFDRLLANEPDNLDARVDRARVLAWRGDTDRALTELGTILAEHPDHAGALEARAQFEAWAGRYEASLTSYEQLLSITPDDREARRRQARILSRASDFEGSRAVYERLLADDPDDIDARLGLARSLAFADELDRAVAEYDRILTRDPDHTAALQGKGRTLAWDDRLVEGEEVLRRAVTVEPSDPGSWVVLAQILRWQGRDAAAKEALERALSLSPTNADVREQLRSVDLALAPVARPSTVYESDSDGNRMLTTALTASWHPAPRFQLRADGYRRGLEQSGLERVAFGGLLTGVVTLTPGWRLTAGAGGSVTDALDSSGYLSYRAGARSPDRHPIRVGVDVTSKVLDETAALADRAVRFTSFAGNARWAPAAGWRVDAAAGYALVDGSRDNTRVSGSLSASRRIGRHFSLGAGYRTFGYDEDLDDGYFDPDFYAIGELTGYWRYAPSPWSFLLEAAPGLQQVGSGGDRDVSARGSARIGYLVGRGRELSLSYGYSSAGLVDFSTGSSDYRYTALILALNWVF